MSILKVKKREGHFANFDNSKIQQAIYKALLDVNTPDSLALSGALTDVVISKITDDNISIEKIQDIVEVTLLEEKLVEAARHYILYRDEKRKIREEKKKILQKDSLDEVDKSFSINQLRVLAERYLLRDLKTNKIIESPKEMFRRVATLIGLSDLLHDPSLFSKDVAPNDFKQHYTPPYDKYFKLLDERFINPHHYNRFCHLYHELDYDGHMKKSLTEILDKHFAKLFDNVYESKIQEYYDLMVSCVFMPNTPTLMNAGTQNSKLSACFTLEAKDNIDSYIRETVADAAAIYKGAGGVGINFSEFRPSGSSANGRPDAASGPISFMEMINTLTNVVKSGGARRGANMSILNCLSGDTLIHTLKGKFPIRDLVNTEPYLYCLNEQNELRIRKASKVIHNGQKKLIRLRFDNDDYLDCTPDHRIMLSNGTFKEAGKLEKFDSIMAFYKTSDRGRYMVSTTTSSNWISEQLLAAELQVGYIPKQDGRKRKPEDLCTHHLDQNPLNNDPSNILVTTISAHSKIHIDNLTKLREKIADDRRGKTLEEVYGVEKATEWKKNMSEARKKVIPWNKGLKGEEYLSHYEEGIKNQFSNHKIISVEELDGEHDVYDIIMQDYHNFVANGVFVHNCNHPDIEQFISMKSTPGVLENFNVSVGLWGDFWGALTSGKKEYLLSHPTHHEKDRLVDPQHIWDLIALSAWKSAEPGVLFFDNTNRVNHMINDLGELCITNPCAEQALFANSSCTLGSINISKCLDYNGEFDWSEFESVVRYTTRFLDNVVSMNKYPTDNIEEMALAERRIGLGIMGLADTLFQLEIPYNSKEGFEFMGQICKVLTSISIDESINIARERGPAPLFKYSTQGIDINNKRTLSSLTIPNRQEDIHNHGIRNTWNTTVAPTGTISMIAGCSSGIEPEFALGFEKKVTIGSFFYSNKYLADALKKEGLYSEELLKKIAENGGSIQSIEEIPDSIKKVFVTAMDIHWADHVMAQAACQQYIDNSISKTINCANDVLVDDIKNAYLLAHELGCKGLSVYRDGSRAAQVLHTNSEKTGKQLKPSQYVLDYIKENIKNEYVLEKLGSLLTDEKEVEMVPVIEMKGAASLETVLPKPEKEYISWSKIKVKCPLCDSYLVFKEGCQKCMNCSWGACPSS